VLLASINVQILYIVGAQTGRQPIKRLPGAPEQMFLHSGMI